MGIQLQRIEFPASLQNETQEMRIWKKEQLGEITLAIFPLLIQKDQANEKLKQAHHVFESLRAQEKVQEVHYRRLVKLKSDKSRKLLVAFAKVYKTSLEQIKAMKTSPLGASSVTTKAYSLALVNVARAQKVEDVAQVALDDAFQELQRARYRTIEACRRLCRAYVEANAAEQAALKGLDIVRTSLNLIEPVCFCN